MNNEVVAVVVTYNPPENIVQNTKAIYEQVDGLLVVDNGSSSQSTNQFETIANWPNATVIRYEKNLGIATAINQGFQWAINHGFEYVLTLDQDSFPHPQMVHKLLEVFNSHPLAAKVAVVGPNAIDGSFQIRSRHLRPTGKFTYELITCKNGWLDEVLFVITSGSLCKVSVYQNIGPFQDVFFIDYIDIEYCLRACSLGYKVVVVCDALLSHNLGHRKERKLFGFKVYPRFHPPSRWYYQSRNRISLLMKYTSEFPFLIFYELVNLSYGVVRMLIFEDLRLDKIRAIIMGTFHGLANKMDMHFDH